MPIGSPLRLLCCIAVKSPQFGFLQVAEPLKYLSAAQALW